MPTLTGRSRTTTVEAIRPRRSLAVLCALTLAATLLATQPGSAATRPDAAGLAAGAGPFTDIVDGLSAEAVAEAHARRVAGFPAAGTVVDPAPRIDEVVPGELIVTTRDRAALQRLDRTGWQSVAVRGFTRAVPIGDRVALVVADPARLDAVASAALADPAVIAVEPNRLFDFHAVPDDPGYPDQWAHQVTGIETAWDVSVGSADVVIAIGDSGAVASHADLGGIVEQVDVSSGTVRPGDVDNDPCGVGHGTWVAGVAGATGDNGVGVAGSAWQVSMIDMNTADPRVSCGGPTSAGIIRSITYAVERGADVVNLSLGGGGDTCPISMQTAIDQARAAGTVVVAAAGNNQLSSGVRPSIPASCNGAISVAATGPDNRVAAYSQRNAFVDFVAPGGANTSPRDATVNILTTRRNGGYEAVAGTSFSTPYVSGLVALMRAVNPSLSVDDIESLLQQTALDLGPTGRDDTYGWGLVQGDAVVAAAAGGPIPPPTRHATFPVEQGEGEQPAASCAGPASDDGGDTVRIADQSPVTDPICQANALSSFLPEGEVPFAVLARVDDYADALAGSSIGLGVGPLLFTSSTGPLDPRTEAELVRILDVTTREPRVYIMGGAAAVPLTVDERLTELGITPVRVAGDGREATAVRASEVVGELTRGVAFPTRDYAFVAFGRNWPDAVGAGQMAARYGIPILLTNSEGLHPTTRSELQRLQPSQVYVLGGTAVISDEVVSDIAALGLDVDRLAGAGRVDTTLAVSAAYLTELGVDAAAGEPISRPLPVALNMDDNYNDILSASFLGGSGNLFMPLAGGGSLVTAPVRQAFCDIGLPALLIGGPDRIGTDGAGAVVDVAGGTAC